MIVRNKYKTLWLTFVRINVMFLFSPWCIVHSPWLVYCLGREAKVDNLCMAYQLWAISHNRTCSYYEPLTIDHGLWAMDYRLWTTSSCYEKTPSQVRRIHFHVCRPL